MELCVKISILSYSCTLCGNRYQEASYETVSSGTPFENAPSSAKGGSKAQFQWWWAGYLIAKKYKSLVHIIKYVCGNLTLNLHTTPGTSYTQ